MVLQRAVYEKNIPLSDGLVSLVDLVVEVQAVEMAVVAVRQGRNVRCSSSFDIDIDLNEIASLINKEAICSGGKVEFQRDFNSVLNKEVGIEEEGYKGRNITGDESKDPEVGPGKEDKETIGEKEVSDSFLPFDISSCSEGKEYTGLDIAEAGEVVEEEEKGGVMVASPLDWWIRPLSGHFFSIAQFFSFLYYFQTFLHLIYYYY